MSKIASLAQLMQSFIKHDDKYFVGIWLNYIWYFLLWHIPYPRPRAVSPANNGSPSWSWTSVNGRLRFIIPAVLRKPDVGSIHCVSEFFDPQAEHSLPSFAFGQVVFASIKAKGVLVKLSAQVRLGRDDFGLRCRLQWKDQDIEADEFLTRLDFLQSWKPGTHTRYCFAVAVDDNWNNSRRLLCLLLEKQEPKATYKRCGTCQIITNFHSKTVWDRALKAQNEGEPLEDDEFHETLVLEGKTTYTITLI